MDILAIIVLIIVITQVKNKKKKPAASEQVSQNTQKERQMQERQRKMQQEMQKKLERQRQMQTRQNQNIHQKRQMQKAAQAYQGSILERAKNNVKEQDQAENRSPMPVGYSEASAGYVSAGQPEASVLYAAVQNHIAGKSGISAAYEPEESLMQQVYDLMITGYSGNLHFERDFLAEGMDMLNRIQQ